MLLLVTFWCPDSLVNRHVWRVTNLFVLCCTVIAPMLRVNGISSWFCAGPAHGWIVLVLERFLDQHQSMHCYLHKITVNLLHPLHRRCVLGWVKKSDILFAKKTSRSGEEKCKQSCSHLPTSLLTPPLTQSGVDPQSRALHGVSSEKWSWPIKDRWTVQSSKWSWTGLDHTSPINQSINQTRQFLTRRNTALPLQGRNRTQPPRPTLWESR